MHAWSYIVRFFKGLALAGNRMKKDETFQFIRWINLMLGFINIYYYMVGAGYFLLSIAMLNIGAWVFTRSN